MSNDDEAVARLHRLMDAVVPRLSRRLAGEDVGHVVILIDRKSGKVRMGSNLASPVVREIFGTWLAENDEGVS